MANTIDIGEFIENIEKRPIIWSRDINVASKGYLEDTWDELAEIHNCPKRILKSKWKGLRDNFRIEWKKIPRDENDQLLIPAEEFTGSKWQYFQRLVFLADHMRTRSQIALGCMENVKFEAVLEPDECPDNSSDSKSDPNECENENDDEPQLPNLIPINRMTSSASPSSSLYKISNNNGRMSQQYSPPGTTSLIQSNKNNKEKDSLKRKLEQRQMNDDDDIDLARDDDYCFLMSLYPYMQLSNGLQNLKLRIKIQKLLFKELFRDEYDDEHRTISRR